MALRRCTTLCLYLRLAAAFGEESPTSDWAPVPSSLSSGLPTQFYRVTVGPEHQTDPRPIVATRNGKVMGIASKGVHVFRGIPYAAPPIKHLRWRPPQPVNPWSDVLNASAFGNRCVSPLGGGDEDCLFLNVFAPPRAGNVSLPCLLWVHGGGYESGSSNLYDATNLAKFYIDSHQPAVVITINYRMNIFGFLGSDALRRRDAADGSTGNYGIQDQRAAFRWVRANIEAFGGDPQRVMIFGESAGAGSMSNHLSMQRSAGLFSSVAIQSGSFSGWTAQPLSYSEMVYKQVLTFTGCADDACLEALPAANLTVAVINLPIGNCCNDTAGKPFLPWGPTIDGVELRAHPWTLARRGDVTKVPVLHGTNTDDGSNFEPLHFNTTVDAFTASFVQWYGSKMGPADASAAAKAIYLGGETHPHMPFVTHAWWAAERSLTDQSFNCPARHTSTQLSAHGVEVFQYVFSHSPASTSSPVSFHGADVPYVFIFDAFFETAEELLLAKQIASYWYRHAAFGNPNGKHPTESQVIWPKYSSEAEHYLQLDVSSAGGIRSVQKPYRARSCSFMGEWLEKEIASSQFSSSESVIV